MDIFALPLHPLLVHFPVVLIPLFIAAIVSYILVPHLRQRIGWLVMGLAIAASLGAVAGWWSGHQFYDEHVEMIAKSGADTSKFTALLAQHLSYGDITVWLVPATAALTLLFGYLDRKRRNLGAIPTESGDATAGEAPYAPAKLAMTGLAVVILVAAAVSAWFVFQTGHSGADVVWSPKNN